MKTTATRPRAERAVKRAPGKTANRPAKKPGPLQDAAASAAVGLGPLPDFIGYMLRRAQIAVFDDFMRQAKSVDLRPGQFSTLLLVESNPGAKQSDVAAALGIQGTNFVSLINQLERRNLVERRALDRRSYGLHLTGDGRALLKQALKMQDAQEKAYEEILGEGGRKTLLELLARLTVGLEKA